MEMSGGGGHRSSSSEVPAVVVEMACDGYPDLWSTMRAEAALIDCHLQSSEGTVFVKIHK